MAGFLIKTFLVRKSTFRLIKFRNVLTCSPAFMRVVWVSRYLSYMYFLSVTAITFTNMFLYPVAGQYFYLDRYQGNRMLIYLFRILAIALLVCCFILRVMPKSWQFSPAINADRLHIIQNSLDCLWKVTVLTVGELETLAYSNHLRCLKKCYASNIKFLINVARTCKSLTFQKS